MTTDERGICRSDTEPLLYLLVLHLIGVKLSRNELFSWRAISLYETKFYFVVKQWDIHVPLLFYLSK
ncbi:hypothetical protein J2S19_002233 [Metabacillus malikii]|uniref:Transposase n=1 Tax=Metabacillus malikii TaxID=1504265 RepID=A0ABT9ZFD7_9BACI|nr:hypothetical protein [Metabacillus malikii]